jgi:hypothetical protein
MILAFTLSMPNVGSWNGRWTGEGNLYCKVINFGRGKEATVKAEAILKEGYYHYNFGDGWSAGVSIKQVTSEEGRKLTRRSQGFCGYDWMIDSIRNYNEILNSLQVKKRKEEEANGNNGQTTNSEISN